MSINHPQTSSGAKFKATKLDQCMQTCGAGAFLVSWNAEHASQFERWGSFLKRQIYPYYLSQHFHFLVFNLKECKKHE